MLIKSIGKLILDYPDFQLLITKTCHVINRRPVAFNETLQSPNCEDVDPITPEMLLFGRELVSVNVIPQVQSDYTDNFENENLRDDYGKLRQSIKRMTDIYSQEFLTKLTCQSLDKGDRYKPVIHKKLSTGDIVLLIEPNMKRSNYPMGRIKSVSVNLLDEVTSAEIVKGKTREVVYRHATSLIPLLSSIPSCDDHNISGVSHDPPILSDESNPVHHISSNREASKNASLRIKNMYSKDLV